MFRATATCSPFLLPYGKTGGASPPSPHRLTIKNESLTQVPFRTFSFRTSFHTILDIRRATTEQTKTRLSQYVSWFWQILSDWIDFILKLKTLSNNITWLKDINIIVTSKRKKTNSIETDDVNEFLHKTLKQSLKLNYLKRHNRHDFKKAVFVARFKRDISSLLEEASIWKTEI